MTFRIDLSGIHTRECFAEASREELRVLLALASLGGSCADEAELARAAGVSPARCRSALVLWQESGVIAKSADGSVIIDEFREMRDSTKRYEKPSGEVARSIRDTEMAAFLEECANLMSKPALNTEEIKDLEYILNDLGVSKEYVLLLVAHLVERRKSVTPRTVLTEINKLLKKNVDTVEALEVYIIKVEKTTREEWEFKNKFELYRALSPTEKKYISRWYNELGFTTEIVYAAYGAATKTVSSSIPYSKMNRILTAWHEAGCTSVSECLDKGEAYRAAKEAEQRAAEKAKREEERKSAKEAAGSKDSNNGKVIPKYSNFDVDEALMKALERSYNPNSNDDE